MCAVVSCFCADAFERERVDFLQRLDEMAGNSREKHTLKWEVHKKDEQIMDLQKALSDAHVFLYEERAQVLKLTAENDRLKSQMRSVHTNTGAFELELAGASCALHAPS